MLIMFTVSSVSWHYKPAVTVTLLLVRYRFISLSSSQLAKLFRAIYHYFKSIICFNKLKERIRDKKEIKEIWESKTIRPKHINRHSIDILAEYRPWLSVDWYMAVWQSVECWLSISWVQLEYLSNVGRYVGQYVWQSSVGRLTTAMLADSWLTFNLYLTWISMDNQLTVGWYMYI